MQKPPARASYPVVLKRHKLKLLNILAHNLVSNNNNNNNNNQLYLGRVTHNSNSTDELVALHPKTITSK